jgi:hypothetical protein
LRGSEKSAGAFVEWVLRVAILRFFNVPPEGSKTDAVNTWVNRTLKEGGRMPSLVSATFEVKDWVEPPLDEVEMPKATRAVVAKTYSGDIDGTSTTEWLMSSAEDGSATFVGMERISGTVGGRDGSFVVKHDGKYEGGAAVGSLTVVRGSGTDALKSVEGAGTFRADPAGSVRLNIAVD